LTQGIGFRKLADKDDIGRTTISKLNFLTEIYLLPINNRCISWLFHAVKTNYSVAQAAYHFLAAEGWANGIFHVLINHRDGDFVNGWFIPGFHQDFRKGSEMQTLIYFFIR
jgi:hypothetical protein